MKATNQFKELMEKIVKINYSKQLIETNIND